MIVLFKKVPAPVRRFIRAVYLALIVILAVFAFITWRQLQTLRNAPVLLPNYWFYVIETRGKGALIDVQGTWAAADSASRPDRVQTSYIKCIQAKMQCMESTAVVSVDEGSFLETSPRVYEVNQWNETEVVSKPNVGSCSTSQLSLNLVDRTATLATSLLPEKTACKDAPRTLRLGNGRQGEAAGR